MESTFESKKTEVLQKLEDLLKAYDELTFNVHPEKWRIVGMNVSEMRSIYKDISAFTEMSEEQKNDPKIQKLLGILGILGEGDLFKDRLINLLIETTLSNGPNCIISEVDIIKWTEGNDGSIYCEILFLILNKRKKEFLIIEEIKLY